MEAMPKVVKREGGNFSHNDVMKRPRKSSRRGRSKIRAHFKSRKESPMNDVAEISRMAVLEIFRIALPR